MRDFSDVTLGELIKLIPEIHEIHLLVYARLWQFEIWLRHMVYVELRAKYGDEWSDHLEGKKEYVKENDASMTHMPTPEKMDLSYVTFRALIETVTEEWDIYSKYLPPQDIWKAKIKEIFQIRNRIAHFRRGNSDDLPRILQLLRDIDKGFFEFCTSLNKPMYLESKALEDPIIRHFSPLNPYVGRDLSISPNSIYDHYANSFEIKIEIISRPWSSIPNNYFNVIGHHGYFYDLNIHAFNGRKIGYKDFLHATKSIHNSLLYIILSGSEDHIRVIFPSILGEELLIVYFDQIILAFANNLWPGKEDELLLTSDAMKSDRDRIQNFADSYPEYVIGPNNPISFLEPFMECSFFSA